MQLNLINHLDADITFCIAHFPFPSASHSTFPFAAFGDLTSAFQALKFGLPWADSFSGEKVFFSEAFFFFSNLRITSSGKQ